MKKIVISMLVLLFVSILAVTASAQDAQAVREEVGQKIAQAEAAAFSPVGLSGRELDEAWIQAVREAGVQVIDEASEAMPQSLDIDPAIMELAYLDLDSAAPEMKGEILAAREKIIYSCSWTADPEAICYSTDPETGVVTVPPRFQSLFPGWDMPGSPAWNAALAEAEGSSINPVEEAAPAEPQTEDISLVTTADTDGTAIDSVVEGLAALAAVPDEVVIAYDNSLAVYKPRTAMSTPFCWIPGKESVFCEYQSYANMFSGLTSINIGFTNASNQNLGYGAGLKVNEPWSVKKQTGASIGVRASTNGPEGHAWMIAKRIHHKTTGM